ncbi:SLBB domain-containing protein [Sporomusa malonica]|uniref:SLBB domain-containing protein n=1 Tax=Sporomusa malonica TaxID=112901 RepID=A0A1W2EA74_9FIRM|nr:SLBB domain-containing protein [Sporomusa malonica]SMD06447.1 SLBB domain-containing protein [Sporomusa malonica]
MRGQMPPCPSRIDQLNKRKKKFRLSKQFAQVTAMAFLITIFTLFAFPSYDTHSAYGSQQTSIPAPPADTFKRVSGYVYKPGVYKVPENYRIIDVVAVAGGFSPGAAPERIDINQEIGQEFIIEIPGKSPFPDVKKK